MTHDLNDVSTADFREMIVDREAQMVAIVSLFKGRVSDGDVESCMSFATHSEWGLALEEICTALDEAESIVTAEELSLIKEAGAAMGIDSSYWEDLTVA